MEVTHIIDSKQAIQAELRFRYKTVMAYALKRRFNPNHVENLLKGRTHHSTHPELVKAINADTGADMAAWEK